jgi:hypothetical protein
MLLVLLLMILNGERLVKRTRSQVDRVGDLEEFLFRIRRHPRVGRSR